MMIDLRGLEHFIYPTSEFTAEQLAILKAHPGWLVGRLAYRLKRVGVWVSVQGEEVIVSMRKWSSIAIELVNGKHTRQGVLQVLKESIDEGSPFGGNRHEYPRLRRN